MAFLLPSFRQLIPLTRGSFALRVSPQQRRHLFVAHATGSHNSITNSSANIQPKPKAKPTKTKTTAGKTTTTRSKAKSSSTTKTTRTTTKKATKTTKSSSASKATLQPASPSLDAPTLVIVESPTKASTIQSILPSSEYIVRSCVGHIRELPSSAKEIPTKYRQHNWALLGVNVETDFRPIYIMIPGKKAVITDLRKQLSNSSKLILATDDDREGEAISWHLLEVLKPSIPVHRAVFHEITADAVRSAFNSFRELDMALVDAQETRRVLDRLAGYTMSPLLWTKIARGLSAGRVQSVAMAQIVQRERERLEFVTAEYSSASLTLSPKHKGKQNQAMQFEATMAAVDGVRLVKGSDFDDKTGKLKLSVDPSSVLLFNQEQIEQLCKAIHTTEYPLKVTSVECRKTTRNPPPPLITSTLQQECGNRLGMGAGRTMSIAQRLYETGVITYMRTDNPTLSDDAVAIARAKIEELYGKESLWDGTGKTRSASKPKAAQAAHEAIRPAGSDFIHPDQLITLDNVERSVYTLIYRRALASQMAPAKLDQTTMRLSVRVHNDFMGKGSEDAGEVYVEFKASGSVIIEPGFLQLYQDVDSSSSDVPSSSSSSSFLPPLAANDTVLVDDTSVLNHETKPPPRFNDASLVKVLEERGVGRPSTYAGIIELLITRGYVYRGRDLPPGTKIPPKALVPSLTAFAVERLLSTHFPSFVDADFTARMEHALDEIATGSGNRISYLNEYYNGEEGLAQCVERTKKNIDGAQFKHVILPNMPKDMINVAPLTTLKERKKKKKKPTAKDKKDDDKEDNKQSRSMCRTADGTIDWSKTRVLVNSYGPYVEQDGNIVASLPKTTVADDLTEDRLQSALLLAEDPVIGKDPDTGFDVLLKASKFGKYIQLGHEHDVQPGEKPRRCGLSSLKMGPGEVTLELALKLLSLPRFLGTHPTSGLEVRAAVGPYGPYVVTHESSTFVSLKEGSSKVWDISLDEAVELIDAAEERKRKRLEAQRLKQMASKDGEANKKKKEDDQKRTGGNGSATTANRTTKTRRSSKKVSTVNSSKK